MPLQDGDRLPDVRLPSASGEMVSFRDFVGEKPLVVLFFPLAFTSTCTEEMCTVGDDLGAYQDLDAQVVAVSVDSPFVLARFKKECNAEFPFLSDFNREAVKTFGVMREEPVGPGLRGASERAAFVADRDGVIRYAWMSKNPSALPPFDEIKAALR
ncbi:MAG TPA: peroxiredoxin [Longimicrobiaceae bacterium]|nr:peroxiredoxin [Longimicrobiaceae bacterium]